MKREFKIIADLLPNNSRVLDVGCGDDFTCVIACDKKNPLAILLKTSEKTLERLECSRENIEDCGNQRTC